MTATLTRAYASTEELAAAFGPIERYAELDDRQLVQVASGLVFESLHHGEGQRGGWVHVGRQWPAAKALLEPYVPPTIGDRLCAPEPAPVKLPADLNLEQRASLEALGRGLTLPQAADALHIHLNTLKYRIRQAKLRLGLPHDAPMGELVAAAIVRGQIPDRRQRGFASVAAQSLMAHLRAQIPDGPLGDGVRAWLDQAFASWGGRASEDVA